MVGYNELKYPALVALDECERLTSTEFAKIANISIPNASKTLKHLWSWDLANRKAYKINGKRCFVYKPNKRGRARLKYFREFGLR